MHDLAEAGHIPAVEVYQSFLDDADWDWRKEGVTLLGFHYLFTPESEILQKFRQLLQTDPEVQVRLSAALALGTQLARMAQESELETKVQWPDHALVYAMQSDIDEDARYAAFDALLSSAGVPYPIVTKEVGEAEKAGIRPTLEDVRRILQDAGISLELPN
jgi:HEAT repeat protein